MRLKQVLPEIIHSDQTAYIEDRNITDILRKLVDIIDYTKANNIQCILIAGDFEKAFDSLEWNFIFKTLEVFNSGKEFISWIKTLYNGISACTINNGHSSGYFDLERGVRQGDPLSPYLFILTIELLAHHIRRDKNIKGIQIANNESKLSQYADDTTAIVSDKNSAKRFLDKFEKASGLKVNKVKTEALWIGSARNNISKPLGLNWQNQTLKILGMYIGYDNNKIRELNWEKRIDALKTTLNIWNGRNLTISGRVFLAKSLGISKILYISSVSPVDQQIINNINSILYAFIWKGQNKERIKRNMLISKPDHGGLNMLDLESIIKASRIKLLTKYFNGSDSILGIRLRFHYVNARLFLDLFLTIQIINY